MAKKILIVDDETGVGGWLGILGEIADAAGVDHIDVADAGEGKANLKSVQKLVTDGLDNGPALRSLVEEALGQGKEVVVATTREESEIQSTLHDLQGWVYLSKSTTLKDMVPYFR